MIWEQNGNKTHSANPVFWSQPPQGQSSHQLVGGGVWESNPPFDPRRAESAALKAATVTGPFSPPMLQDRYKTYHNKNLN
jgi:hypothetical protein